jgi:uncharacterized protein
MRKPVKTTIAIFFNHVYYTPMKSKHAFNIALVLPVLFALLLFFAPVTNAAETAFPRPSGAINDFAGVIQDSCKAPMENLARQVLDATGTALVVAAVPTVGDDDPNDYANRLYKAWGIGKKGEDKGVLIFLAVKERQVRIETGYGVEGILPDGLTGEILDKYAVPAFRAGDYGRGLYDTLSEIAVIVARDAGVTLSDAGASRPPPPRRAKEQGKSGLLHYILLIIAAVFLLGTRQGRAMLPWILMLLMNSGGGRRGGGGGGFGGGFGGFGGGMSGGGGSSRGF